MYVIGLHNFRQYLRHLIRNLLVFFFILLCVFCVRYFQHQRELTPEIEALMYFTLSILPVLQYFITAILLASGFTLIVRSILQCLTLNMTDLTVVQSKARMHADLQDVTWNIKQDHS